MNREELEKHLKIVDAEMAQWPYWKRNDLQNAGKAMSDTPREPLAYYGFCPHCGARGVDRERRLNGNDTCKNGHRYPSKDARP